MLNDSPEVRFTVHMLASLLLACWLGPAIWNGLLGLLLAEDAYRRKQWEERQRKARLAQRLGARTLNPNVKDTRT